MEAKRLKPKRTVSPKVLAARKAAQNIILSRPDKEAEADSVLASLSVLAFPLPGADDDILVVDEGAKDSKYKSRFFYKPDPSFVDEVEQRKAKFKPHAIENIDAVVEARLKQYKKSMPPLLQQNIEAVREYFLSELAPLTLASTAGASQAQDVVQRLIGGPVDGAVFSRYDRMLHTAVNMSMARFIAKYVKLPKAAADILLAELTPKQPAIIPVPFENPQGVKKQMPVQQRTKPVRKHSAVDEPRRVEEN